jgi:hypothetical protein
MLLGEGKLQPQDVNAIAAPLDSDHYGPQLFRSIDTDGRRVLLGTYSCTIFEMKQVPGPDFEALIYGHSDDVNALAFHPSDHGLYVTGSDNGVVYEWDTATRELKRHCSVQPRDGPRRMVRSAAFSPDGRHLALGCSDGSWLVLNFPFREKARPAAPRHAATSPATHLPRRPGVLRFCAAARAWHQPQCRPAAPRPATRPSS